jgi:UDP-N-acetylglucosamine--N-acetylmuramyl-(pentapeptide) pyrophosphoryl-undecaprenol N-acetylglucosamine transferase
MIAPIRRRTLVFAGGGTGGHLYPALALARNLPGLQPLFVVPDNRGDAARLGDEFESIPLPLPRIDKGKLLFPARLAVAVRRARRVLKARAAVAVVGMGGYGAVPVCLAARTLRLPIYLIECNAVAGRATRVLARLATGVGLGSWGAFAQMQRYAACRVTGTPVRDETLKKAKAEDFGLDPDRPTLLVVGGSQGAVGLNTRVLDGVAFCQDLDFQVLHCAGAADADRVGEAYRLLARAARVVDFVGDMGAAYAVADLVLARGGASTVAECLTLRQPAVFVPYPHHKDAQQVWNAWDAVREGAARLVKEEDLSPVVFRQFVTELLLDPGECARMSEAAASVGEPGAARAMAAHLLETLGPAVGEESWMAELGE